jgi:hypothetical protein
LGLAVATAVCGGAPQTSEYVFVQDVGRFVGIDRGGVLYLGKLDAEGNFVQHEVYPGGKPLSAIPAYAPLTFFGTKPKQVYEYRSGRLIKGELTPDANFIPAIGSTVIGFEDYQYSPTAIPIWNLPGYFSKKD